LQFSLQAASPETFGYTFIFLFYDAMSTAKGCGKIERIVSGREEIMNWEL
jgi:hypothetical protein